MCATGGQAEPARVDPTVMVRAAMLAGRVCRHVQRQMGPGGPLSHEGRRVIKADNSPVTIADFAAQAVVNRTLAEGLGAVKFGMMGEESGSHFDRPGGEAELAACVTALRDSGVWPEADATAVRAAVDLGAAESGAARDGLLAGAGGTSGGAGLLFTLDPIDGTKGFLKGRQYAVCLAQLAAAPALGPGLQPVGAVLVCPNLPGVREHEASDAELAGLEAVTFGRGVGGDDEQDAGTVMWTAGETPGVGVMDGSRLLAQRTGAFGAGDGRAVRLAEGVEPGHSNLSKFGVLLAALGGAGGGGAGGGGAGPGVKPSVRIDSQCKYAVVARGWADAYVRFPHRPPGNENIWDHASGVAMLRGVGCTVTDLDGRPLDFSGPKMTGNRGILGAPPALHARLLKVIAREGL
ncbi:MAG: hypothetical protein LW650_15170 [Planctomycetaceae bacterium]|nr:hypothetical protein [Planctomycetaceae bacterium]